MSAPGCVGGPRLAASVRRRHGTGAAGAPRCAGQTTAEFALLLPLFLLLALGMVQVALVLRDDLAVAGAAREGARVAAVDADSADVARSVRAVLPGAVVTVGPRPAVGGLVTVSVAYRSPGVVPLVGPLLRGGPTLRARAAMQVER